MKDRNIYANPELKISIEKPESWMFVPAQQALALLTNRTEPGTEEDDEFLDDMREPLFYFHYDHRLSDQVIPTVYGVHRIMRGVGSADRPTFLRMQLLQLEIVFQDFNLIEATSDGLISKRPANIIKSTFSIYNQDREEVPCLSRGYLIFADDFLFSIEMYGPLEGNYLCEEEFRDILSSLRID